MSNSDFLLNTTSTGQTESSNVTPLNVQQSSHNHADDEPQSLRECVAHAMETYFENLDGHSVTDVYQMVLSEVEAPLLEAVLKYTRNNQTRTAQVLGLNRGTLRKKLKQYGLL
jgi:Fis family transcriptional regulator